MSGPRQPATFPDPDIRHGPFRVLPRTDGGYVIADERRPAGDQAVRDPNGKIRRFRRAEEAGLLASKWAAMQS